MTITRKNYSGKKLCLFDSREFNSIRSSSVVFVI